MWGTVDDEYLQDIVTLVYNQIGAKNIKAFWLVGHSQGGMTSNRIVRTDFFQEQSQWLAEFVRREVGRQSGTGGDLRSGPCCNDELGCFYARPCRRGWFRSGAGSLRTCGAQRL